MKSKWTSFLSVPSNGAVIGVVVGVAIVVMMTFTESNERHEAVLAELSTPGEAAAFVNDWKAMQTSEWYVESTFTRTLQGEEVLNTTTVQAQRPPESVVVAGGTVTASLGGKRTVCSMGTDQGAPSCREVGSYDFEAERTQQLEVIRSAVSGPNARYGVVERSDHCHQLRPTAFGFTQPTETLQWGSDAVFCFDAETSAMVSSRITRENGFDVSTAEVIRGVVTDEDLQRLAARR